MYNIKLYYSIGFMELSLKFWRQISKSTVRGFAIKAQIFNAGLIKPTMYNFFSYISIMFITNLA